MITMARLRGHWQRDWIRAPGRDDATTRVHWLQSALHFADIRIPLHRPGLDDARCLADLAPADMAVLVEAEGFAGHITLHEDTCTWHRAVNWQGFPCPADVGKLWVDPAGKLIEDGVHADYREQWARVTGPPFGALRASGSGIAGFLLLNTKTFLLVAAPVDVPARPELCDGLRSGRARTADAAPVFESVCIMGQRDGDCGTATLSTQPFCEGRTVLSLGMDAATLTLPGFDGSLCRVELSLVPLQPDPKNGT